MHHKAIPYLVFFALLVAGGVSAYKIFSPGDTVSPIINSNNTIIINMISADVGKDPDAVKEFKNVEVQIRAADMDSVKTGWAAKIPSVLDRRIKVKVDGFVDVSKIRMGANVRADVIVVYKSDGEQSKPSYAIIQKIY